jgi:hypothetical protein
MMQSLNFGFIIFIAVLLAVWWHLASVSERVAKIIVVAIIFIAGGIMYSNNPSIKIPMIVLASIVAVFTWSTTMLVLQWAEQRFKR